MTRNAAHLGKDSKGEKGTTSSIRKLRRKAVFTWADFVQSIGRSVDRWGEI